MNSARSTANATATPKLGRRPGSESSRADVLRAARSLFANDGFSATTIRAIAAEAGVDSALVMQFYGSKENLFAAVIDELRAIPVGMRAAAFEADPRQRATLLITAYLQLWEAPETREPMRALVRGAIGSPAATRVVHHFLDSAMFADGPPPELAAAGGMLLGVAIARYVVEAGPLAQMPFDELVATLAPSIQVQLQAHFGD